MTITRQVETIFRVIVLGSGSPWKCLPLLSARLLRLLFLSLLLLFLHHSHPRLLQGSIIPLPQVLSRSHQQVSGVKLIPVNNNNKKTSGLDTCTLMAQIYLLQKKKKSIGQFVSLTWWTWAAGGSVPGCVAPLCQETGPWSATAGCESWGSLSSHWGLRPTSAALGRAPPRPRFLWRHSQARPWHPTLHRLRPAILFLWQAERKICFTHICIFSPADQYVCC